MPRAPRKKPTPPAQEPDSPALLEVSRQLAVLAVAHQGGPLTHRQREELRRALATAGELLGWSGTRASGVDPIEAAAKDVIDLAQKGFESLERDLVAERAEKQTEISRLGEVASQAAELASKEDSVYPAEITYSYTARDSLQRLVTRTTTSTVSDSREALGAAETLRKSIEGRTKLTDLMVVDLEERRERLQSMPRHLPEFVRSSYALLGEVIANLS